MPPCKHFFALLDIDFPHSLQAFRAMNSSPLMSCHTIFFSCVDMGDRKTDLSPRARGNLADSLRSVRATIAISRPLLEPTRSLVTKSNTQKKDPKIGVPAAVSFMAACPLFSGSTREGKRYFDDLKHEVSLRGDFSIIGPMRGPIAARLQCQMELNHRHGHTIEYTLLVPKKVHLG